MINNKTIKEIDKILKSKRFSKEYENILVSMKQDNRLGVQKLYKRELNKIEQKEKKHKLSMNMYKLENKLKLNGYNYIAGVDEAGRGPLAGPVVVAAVILADLDPETLYQDSKQLTPAKRALLYDKLKNECLSYFISVKSSQEIDNSNILNTTLNAMNESINNLEKKPSYILVDGNIKIPRCSIKQKAIVAGDTKIRVIAAASILAKVYRDQLMIEYDKKYPLYKFAKHKGYGTAEHIKLIKKYGPCEIHRLSFLNNII